PCVDEYKSDGSRATSLGQHLLDPPAHESTIRQAREGVVVCLVGEASGTAPEQRADDHREAKRDGIDPQQRITDVAVRCEHLVHGLLYDDFNRIPTTVNPLSEAQIVP